MTIERLAALAAFYDVPITHLLPDPHRGCSRRRTAPGLLLDLTRLADHDGRTDPSAPSPGSHGASSSSEGTTPAGC